MKTKNNEHESPKYIKQADQSQKSWHSMFSRVAINIIWETNAFSYSDLFRCSKHNNDNLFHQKRNNFRPTLPNVLKIKTCKITI